ncbi:MAG: C40 family peptidase [Cocleimonas sp.]|nr:C40 family peptidase [Cocleimonas sp.]
MNIVNRIFTTIFCVLLLSFSTYTQAVEKDNSNELITIEDLQSAYQLLVLDHADKTQQLQFQQRQNVLTQKATLIAKKQLKIRYQWGGTTPKKGFDCSGLIQYSFKKANISLPRTAASQYEETKRIPLSQLQSGDLIFFHTRRRKHVKVNHVGIYLGDNKFIHAPRRGKTVTIAKLNRYWKGKVVGAGRIEG